MFPITSKVIVIDDMMTMRKIIKKALTEVGFTKIEEADDGMSAWPKLCGAIEKNEPFELILCDWNMPKMRGIELLQKVRAHDGLKHLPFIMITAESDKQQVLEAIKSGVTHYVVKPFNGVQLKAKLEEAFARHQQMQKK